MTAVSAVCLPVVLALLPAGMAAQGAAGSTGEAWQIVTPPQASLVLARDGALIGDTLYDLGTARGLAHVIVELRQDLIGTEQGAAHWAGVVGDALAPVLTQPDLHIIEHHPSRAGARVAIPKLRRTS